MPATTVQTEHYRIEIKRVRRALAQPLQTGGGRSISVRHTVLLKVVAQSDPARIGYGEAATLPWFGSETAEQSAAVLASLGNVLQLEPFRSADKTAPIQDAPTGRATAPADSATVTDCAAGQLWQDTLAQRLPHTVAPALDAAPCTRWALECALRQANALPQLPRLFAGIFADKPADAEVAALLPAGTLAVPQSLIAAGFRVFKIKIGVRHFADEVATITALLASLRQNAGATSEPANAIAGATIAPPDKAALKDNLTPTKAAPIIPLTDFSPTPLRLRLDANASLSPADLQAWLQQLAPFAGCIDFIEQPLPKGQEQQTAEIFAKQNHLTPTAPLAFAFDESLTSLPQLQGIGEQFPQAVLVVKPALLGSAEGFLRWRNFGANRQRRIVYSTALETGIGIHHALNLVAADPCPLEPLGFGTGGLFADDGLGAPPRQAATIALNSASFAAGGQAAKATAAQSAGDPAHAQHLRAQMEAIWRQA